ncbi:restriction endonuclease subunit S [Escherichia coli]|uniref:restriction endonuclease subunit S n=1 Tax=Escherichia coli TaxID=562 RepID=UPI00222770CC|nr:restriction endonuclease subunit S [Escherichia coli]MCW3431061.1 restriction endonuclease subunit S [Escherichia coli]MCW7157759.1 restriction endonuclease subunit S [Escherichia coli]MCW7400851.1 restriction endonuclease subunit S [Escherichia coli]
MGSKWIEVSLGEISEKIGDGIHGTPTYNNSGNYYFINGSNLIDNSIKITETTKCVDHDEYLKHRKKLSNNTVLVSINGTIGNTALYNNENIILGKSACYINLKDNISKHFILYVLSGYLFQEYIQRCSTGSTIKNVSLKMMRDFRFLMPESKEEQKKVVRIIQKIDELKRLNNAQNQTLEQMSQTLFKSWFVDFDPVIDNALDAGNPIPEALQTRAELRQKVRNSVDFKPLSAEIRSLFPNEFEETELGLIPKGWKFSNVNSLLKNTIGGDWGCDSRDEKHTIQAVIVRGTDIPELISGRMSSAPCRWVEPKKLEKRKINNGDIIIEVSGGSPTQSTGRSIFMTEQIISRLGGIIEPASFCRKFEPLSIEIGLIISLHLNKIYNDGKMWEYQNQSTGIANFQTKYFLEAEHIVMPDVEIINTFYNIVMPWIDKSHNNNQIVLSNLRDTLLPKLISGELSLEDLPDLTTDTEAA